MISIASSRELQATILAMKSIPRELRNDINKTARAKLKPIWIESLSANALDAMSQKSIVSGARVAVTARQISLMAATRRRPLSGGFIPATQWHNVEFGAKTHEKTFQQRSPLGKVYQRTATINAQFPNRQKHGRIAMDAASHTGRQIVALWVQTVVEELATAPGVEVTP